MIQIYKDYLCRPNDNRFIAQKENINNVPNLFFKQISKLRCKPAAKVQLRYAMYLRSGVGNGILNFCYGDHIESNILPPSFTKVLGLRQTAEYTWAEDTG